MFLPLKGRLAEPQNEISHNYSVKVLTVLGLKVHHTAHCVLIYKSSTGAIFKYRVPVGGGYTGS